MTKENIIKMIDFSVMATEPCDNYAIGLCNGLLLARSFITGDEPNFLSIYKEVDKHE